MNSIKEFLLAQRGYIYLELFLGISIIYWALASLSKKYGSTLSVHLIDVIFPYVICRLIFVPIIYIIITLADSTKYKNKEIAFIGFILVVAYHFINTYAMNYYLGVRYWDYLGSYSDLLVSMVGYNILLVLSGAITIILTIWSVAFYT